MKYELSPRKSRRAVWVLDASAASVEFSVPVALGRVYTSIGSSCVCWSTLANSDGLPMGSKIPGRISNKSNDEADLGATSATRPVKVMQYWSNGRSRLIERKSLSLSGISIWFDKTVPSFLATLLWNSGDG